MNAPDPSLPSRLTTLTLRDAHRLGRRLEGTRKIRDEQARAAALREIDAEIAAARSRLDARLAAVPPIGYPDELPVSQRRDDIAAAIRDHQVVVVAGEPWNRKITEPEDLVWARSWWDRMTTGEREVIGS